MGRGGNGRAHLLVLFASPITYRCLSDGKKNQVKDSSRHINMMIKKKINVFNFCESINTIKRIHFMMKKRKGEFPRNISFSFLTFRKRCSYISYLFGRILFIIFCIISLIRYNNFFYKLIHRINRSNFSKF